MVRLGFTRWTLPLKWSLNSCQGLPLRADFYRPNCTSKLSYRSRIFPVQWACKMIMGNVEKLDHQQNFQLNGIQFNSNSIDESSEDRQGLPIWSWFLWYSSVDTHSCYVWCHKRGGGLVTHGWKLPDGTPCGVMGSRLSNRFCFNGECRAFDCQSKSIESLDSEPCSTISGNLMTGPSRNRS